MMRDLFARWADPAVPVPPDPDRIDAYEERAAILEFDAHLPRAEAERLAHLEVFETNRR